MELEYTQASTAGERFIQRLNSWEAPNLPSLDHANMRRWASGATWVPPSSLPLVRHRSLDGLRRVITNDRHPPRGFVIEYDLGLVHGVGQPGTQRLIATTQGYFRTPFEGVLGEGFEGLGYVEEAPLPMLDALELRLDPASGQKVLVAGVEDPLYDKAIPIETLGFVESYPINPRRAPSGNIAWNVVTLLRCTHPTRWRHCYDVEEISPGDSVALGGLWTRGGANFVALYRNADGRLTSELLPLTSARGPALKAKLRWAAAPLNWPEGRPKAWAARATASRLRTLVSECRGQGPVSSAATGRTLLGYLQREPSKGWSPLISTVHPALEDQYVTRSTLEATDMGYAVEGVLGYALDWWADRSRDALPNEVKWASRFGQRRRYVEEYHPERNLP